jgi:hypothetical protein
MAQTLKKLSGKTKSLIYLELLLIYAGALLVLLEIGYTIHLKDFYSTATNTFFLFFINNRLALNTYLNELLYKNDSRTDSCDPGFTKHVFYSLKYINNANFTDVTNTTIIADRDYDYNLNNTVNADYKGYTYMTFDPTVQGTESVELLYRYDFTSWSGYLFCESYIQIDNDFQAIQFIPNNLSCTDTFPTTKYAIADCGSYLDLFKMCVLTEHLTFVNGTQVTDSLAANPDIDLSLFCPLNYLQMEFFDNPNKTASSNTKLFHWEKVTANNSPENKDKSLMINFLRFPYFSNYYNMSSGGDVFIYTDESKRITLNSGEKNGYTSSLVLEVASLPFTDFYNDSMYINSTRITDDIGKVVKEIYPSEFMFDKNQSSLYKPFKLTEDTDKLKIYLSTFIFPILPAKCYQNIFAKEKVYDIFRFFNDFRFQFFMETSSTLFAWLFVSLFVFIWCHVKIRSAVLYDKLAFRITKADLDSEKMTKYTFKAVESVAYVIIMAALFFQKSSFQTVMDNITKVMIYECFQEDVTKGFGLFKDFITGLNDINETIFNLIITSIVFEFIIFITYLIYDFSDNRVIDIDPAGELQHLKEN